MSYKIYDDDGDPMLSVVVNDWQVFGATLRSVAPDSREWLANHISDAFQREIDKAVKRGIEQHKAEVRALLGIK